MKRLAFTLLVLALSATAITAYADAGPITRVGIDYSGVRNPSSCQVNADDVHPTELRLKCPAGMDRPGGVFVRYRFLKDVGGVRGDATVSADIHQIQGKPCAIRWMAPIRTLRIHASLGTYCHIRSVTWMQP